MKSVAIVAFAALASVASAQNLLSFGEPISATTWTVGATTNSIKLNNDCSNSTVGYEFPVLMNVEIGGLQQPYPDAKTPLTVGTLNCQKKGSSVKITLPDTIPTGDKYSILVKVGDVLSYSALFKVNNAKVPAVIGTTTSSVTATRTTASSSATKAASTTTKAASSTTPSTSPNGAGALKVGSTLALAVVAAAGLLL
ncbi:hypothetical protein BGZ65_004870 [Modicella reniformis]|uniref:Uncharacterized protein n=1 Tax=Modicella reniformis TaxID=1440133 RepID=A0A9P6SLF1_9FUNG|nr:hypothetical protein BGZ65_004870 [Modicella reniformis]